MQAAISSRLLRTFSLSFGVRQKFRLFSGSAGAFDALLFPNTSSLLLAYQNAVRAPAFLFCVDGDKILCPFLAIRTHEPDEKRRSFL